MSITNVNYIIWFISDTLSYIQSYCGISNILLAPKICRAVIQLKDVASMYPLYVVARLCWRSISNTSTRLCNPCNFIVPYDTYTTTIADVLWSQTIRSEIDSVRSEHWLTDWDEASPFIFVRQLYTLGWLLHVRGCFVCILYHPMFCMYSMAYIHSTFTTNGCSNTSLRLHLLYLLWVVVSPSSAALHRKSNSVRKLIK